MPREFEVPAYYRSPSIALVKLARKESDPRKRELSPSLLDFGPVRFKIARHFGFCFGVENAIEIAYRAIRENPGKRIFLLSEMIHNPGVNQDLRAHGVDFLMDTDGSTRIPFDSLTPSDIVIVPAFGTTIEIQAALSQRGIDPYFYDATCPFVEKVWKRAADLGRSDFTVIVHGKKTHEETRATFSHSRQTAQTLVILNMQEAEEVIAFMKGERSREDFMARFGDCVSEGFDPAVHLKRVGVVNQTTMLATETHAIAQRFKQALIEIYGEANLKDHFADTRDTLCYATNENQTATRSLIADGADLAVVVGGYNSSNTSHLVELCEERFPTFYIKDAAEILSADEIRHFDLHQKATQSTKNWLPKNSGRPINIALTSGASCPDQTVDEIVQKIVGFFQTSKTLDEVLKSFKQRAESDSTLRPS